MEDAVFIAPVTIMERKQIELKREGVKFKLSKDEDTGEECFVPVENPFIYYKLIGIDVFGPFFDGNKREGLKVFDHYETSEYRSSLK